MKYSVSNVSVTLTEDEMLVAGSVGAHYAEFTFDSSWDGYAKTAVFRNGNVTVEMLVADGRCEIPWEVLAESGQLYVGIRGELGEKQRPTLWASRKTVYEGAEHGDAPREATADVYQQLLETISRFAVIELDDVKRIVDEYLTENPPTVKESDPTVPDWAKESTKPTYTAKDVGAISEDELGAAVDMALAEAKASGAFDGAPGKQGEPGKNGAPGEPGKTPVKGVDYYTEDDKSEMVAAVLAALPSGDEVSY